MNSNKSNTDIYLLLFNITADVQNIKQELIKINEKIDDNIVIECKRMGHHITFIENIYENIKYPLAFLFEKVKKFSGYKFFLNYNQEMKQLNNISNDE
jgi:hypothetical protein